MTQPYTVFPPRFAMPAAFVPGFTAFPAFPPTAFPPRGPLAADTVPSIEEVDEDKPADPSPASTSSATPSNGPSSLSRGSQEPLSAAEKLFVPQRATPNIDEDKDEPEAADSSEEDPEQVYPPYRGKIAGRCTYRYSNSLYAEQCCYRKVVPGTNRCTGHAPPASREEPFSFLDLLARLQVDPAPSGRPYIFGRPRPFGPPDGQPAEADPTPEKDSLVA